jgi:hypothetical protein
MRPSSILKSRADQERSPLHDVKQHAHFQASLGGAKSFHLWTSETGCCERGVPVLRTHSLTQWVTAATRFAPGPEQKRMPTRSFETAGIMRANNKASQSCRAPDHDETDHDVRIVTADLVEPDGIEPTTSCLQSRRSPN